MRERRVIALVVVLAVAAGVWAAATMRPAGLAGPRELAERWLAAVAANDVDEALELANKIAPDSGSTPVNRAYLELANRNGVPGEFFTGPFNKWDFQLWRDALFFQQQARTITSGEPGDVEKLFAAVVDRVEPKEHKSPQPPWPREIWRRGWGACDRQAWVLCELAYQCGWETQIVYLVDPKTGVSPHTVCELRRPGGEVRLADIFCKVLLLQTSVDEAAVDEAQLLELWPGRADFRAAIQASIFWTPSYPQDYCPRNQVLHERLVKVLGGRCPRFGADPARRMLHYKNLRGKTRPGRRPFKMDLWFYPFRLLRHDVAAARALHLR